MTVKIELTRDEAEELYDAAIYKMRRTSMRAHLWSAAVDLRVACGMHAASDTPDIDAIGVVNEQIDEVII